MPHLKKHVNKMCVCVGGGGGYRDRDTKEEKQTEAELTTHRHKHSHTDSETKRERERGIEVISNTKTLSGETMLIFSWVEGKTRRKKREIQAASHIKVDEERPGFAGFLAVCIVHKVSVSALILQGRQRVDEDRF